MDRLNQRGFHLISIALVIIILSASIVAFRLIVLESKPAGCMISKRFSFLLGQKAEYKAAQAHQPGPLEGACLDNDGQYKLYLL